MKETCTLPTIAIIVNAERKPQEVKDIILYVVNLNGHLLNLLVLKLKRRTSHFKLGFLLKRDCQKFYPILEA